MTLTGSTAAVIGQLSPAQVLFFSSANLPAGVTSTRDLPEWELGQFSTFVNADGTPSKGRWYPNVASGSAPYSDADFGFVLDPDPVSGNAVLRTQITDGFATSNAAQLWRNYDWSAEPEGAPLPLDAYYSWWMRFPQEISYLNSSGPGPTFGFTNHWQLYGVAGANQGPFVSIGAGRNTTHDAYFRWHFNLDDRAVFDLPLLIDEPVPVDQWIFVECRVKASTAADGRWECWIDGRKVLDYTGILYNTGTTRFGTSWGNYGTLQTPTDPVIYYDDLAITTVPILPLLAGESATGRRVTLIGDGEGVRRTIACSDEPYQLTPDATAWGLTTYSLNTRAVGQIPGEQLQNVRAGVRTFALPVQIEGDTEAEIDERLGWLQQVLDPGREIRVQYRRPDGTEREISALYAGGADSVSATADAGHLQRRVVVPLIMKALWPFWRPVANPVTTEGPVTFTDRDFDIVTLVNGGDVDAWPEITVTGYAEGIEAINLTTGRWWRVRRVLEVGDVLRIDTDPRSFGVYVNDVADHPAMDQLSQLAEWHLVPGENHLLVRGNTATGDEPIGSISFRWRPQFGSC